MDRLQSIAQQAPGSLRRAYENSGARDAVQQRLDTAAYYAGPHLSNRAEALASAGVAATPQFGTADAREALGQFREGNYGRGASLMGLGVAGGLLDAIPGEAAVKGVLTGITKAAHYTPDLGMAAMGGTIKAYHGSPHDFDRFDLSKIGTGEGAQAYGHGLYFAENPKTAESYRQTLSDWPTTIRAMLGRDLSDDAVGALQRMRAAHPDDLPRAAKLAQWQSPDLRSIPPAELAGMLGQIAERERPGRMYEVAIHADPERFLDWDKPLTRQARPVARALDDIGIPAGDSGEQIYRALATRNAPVRPDGTPLPNIGVDPAGASAALREAGVPGIKYLDGGSRTAGDGSRNFVTFDDKLVEILRKYGILGPAALGAGAMAMPQGTDQ
jgi:hypothetical protein